MHAPRDLWVRAVRDLPGVTMTVPDNPARYCTITSFPMGDDHGRARGRCNASCCRSIAF